MGFQSSLCPLPAAAGLGSWLARGEGEKRSWLLWTGCTGVLGAKGTGDKYSAPDSVCSVRAVVQLRDTHTWFAPNYALLVWYHRVLFLAPVQNQVARPTLDRANAGISSEIWYAVRGDESR